jgi:hypothetical protein
VRRAAGEGTGLALPSQGAEAGPLRPPYYRTVRSPGHEALVWSSTWFAEYFMVVPVVLRQWEVEGAIAASAGGVASVPLPEAG